MQYIIINTESNTLYRVTSGKGNRQLGDVIIFNDFDAARERQKKLGEKWRTKALIDAEHLHKAKPKIKSYIDLIDVIINRLVEGNVTDK